MGQSVPFVSSSCDLPLSLQCQIQIAQRRLLGFVDETVQQNHAPLDDTEQHAGNAALRQVAADLPQARPERPNERHPDRPGELHVLDVLANDFPVGYIKAPEPFTDWDMPRRQFVKESGKALHDPLMSGLVSKMVRACKLKARQHRNEYSSVVAVRMTASKRRRRVTAGRHSF